MMRSAIVKSIVLGLFLAGLFSSENPAFGQDHDTMDTDWPSSSASVQVGGQSSTGWVRDEDVWGLRAGYNLRRIGFELSYEKLDTTLRPEVFPELGQQEVDADLEFFDLSITKWYQSRYHYKFLLYGGAGYASLDVDDWPLNPADDPSDDFFTLHVGVGTRLYFADRFFLRPDFKARYVEEKDELRLSLTVGLGVGSKQVLPSSEKKPRCAALRWEYLEIKPQAEALAAQMSQAYEKGEVMISKYPTATSCVHQLKMIRERYRRCQPRRGVSLEAISKTIAGLEKAVSSVEAYAENEGVALPGDGSMD